MSFGRMTGVVGGLTACIMERLRRGSSRVLKSNVYTLRDLPQASRLSLCFCYERGTLRWSCCSGCGMGAVRGGDLVAQISRPLSAFSRFEEANRDGVLNCTGVLIDLDPCPFQESLIENMADVPPF